MIGPYVVTTDERRREAWGDPCDTSDFTTVVLDGRVLTVNKLAKESFQMYEAIRDSWDYQLTGNDTGFYSCRHMRHDPDLPMSVHSWAMALDINWLENPAGSKLVTDIPFGMIEDLYQVYTNSGVPVFRWGADWDRDGTWEDQWYIDAMHWECVAHPLDLATGIVYIGERLATYRTVQNMPVDKNGAIQPWAKAVVDWGIDDGLINIEDKNPEDWERPTSNGQYWTFEYRRRNK